MKAFKKWMSILLAFVIFVASMGFVPTKADAATGNYVETVLTKNGSTVTLKVNLRNYYYVSNGEFVVKYDKDVLQLRDVTKGTGTYAAFDIQEVNTSTAGEVIYGFASAAASYKYDTLLTVSFNVKNVTASSTTVTTQIAELGNAGSRYTNAETTLNDTITLETSAPAPERKYTVTFYNQGSVYTTQTAARGDYVTEPAAPVRSGYQFTGWYVTDVERYQTDYYKWDFASDRITGNRRLYAGWTQVQTVSGFGAPTITGVSKTSSWLYGDRALVEWTAVSEAYGYEVYRCATEYGTYSYVTSVRSNNYAYDDTVDSGNTYYYRVRAYKYNGSEAVYSDLSNAYSFRM